MAPLALSCSLFLGLQILAAGSVGAKPVGPDGAAPSEPVVGARALLLPDGEGHGLALQNSTLAWLRTLPGPLAVVTAIGQYRSGKSFLLNQLMGIPCDRGFGVGHKRETQTKGVWAFASTDNVTGATRIYLDTEGFDATGKAQVYDDRIFAFSALASSALLYNLVETIKEADIEKLAFVAQLANEFWRRTHADETDDPFSRQSQPPQPLQQQQQPPLPYVAAQQQQQQQQQHSPRVGAGRALRRHAAAEWTPPALLWLVQRDFLQGSSVDDYLRQALKPVPHGLVRPARRAHQLDPRVTRHLGHGMAAAAAAAAATAVDGWHGPPQPHVRRTELCDLPTSELSPDYLVGLQRVRAWVSAHSAGRGGRLWRSGAELATQVGQLVNVLNAQRIPTAGSVIDAFNRELVQRVLGELRRALAAVGLPLDAAELTAAYQSALAAAQHRLRTDAFGSIGSGSGSATDDFQQGTKVALQTMENENFRASHELCKSLWGHCAASLERLKLNTLPSRRRFRARISECNAIAACVGPAAEETHERLGLAATARARVRRAFLQRITHLLILACVSGILLFDTSSRMASARCSAG